MPNNCERGVNELHTLPRPTDAKYAAMGDAEKKSYDGANGTAVNDESMKANIQKESIFITQTSNVTKNNTRSLSQVSRLKNVTFVHLTG